MSSKDAIASLSRFSSILPCLVIGLLALPAIAPVQAAGMELVSERVVVELAWGHQAGELEATGYFRNASRVMPFSAYDPFVRLYTADFSGPRDMLAKTVSMGIAAYIEPDRKVANAAISVSDPQFTTVESDATKQWWLTKVNAPEAWEIGRGSKDVTVAVIDTGINGKHEDLNDGRIGSGYINYCQIFNPGTGQCMVHISGSIAANENSDDNGHGTIVAGIIGAIPNNAHGIAGMNWQVRIMPVKALDSAGAGVSSDVAAGIVWAVDHGASIINMSLGGTSIEGNTTLTNALSYAFDHSVLVVAAAGNDASLIGNDLDIEPVYPVCNDAGRNMVVGVAAVDMNDRKAPFSNFGRACIDLSAPGTGFFNSRDDQKGLLSTYYDPSRPMLNNVYVYASGTSMASPIVAGVAALLKGLHPDLSAVSLRDRLIQSTLNVDTYNQNSCQGQSCTGRLGSGRIDAQKALQTTTFIADSLIKNSSGNIFLIDNGLRRPISAYVVAQRFPSLAVKSAATSELELLPKGEPLPPLDGTLLKPAGKPVVYTVSRGVLLPASYLAFKSNGFNFSSVVTLPDDEVASYRVGPNLIPGEGGILKRPSEGAVYFMHDGKKRLISYFTFLNRGLKFSDVVDVSEEEFARYPEDAATKLEPPLDGALIKGLSDPTVYVVEDGKLRALSAASFTARNYKFSQVNTLPQSEVSGYGFGVPIN